MPSIGSLSVTTYRTQADQTDYALSGNSVSSTHLASLRRNLPVQKGQDKGVLRSNMRIAKTFDVGDTTKEVTVNYSAVVPVGVDVSAVLTWITGVVEVAVASAAAHALFTSGDINVSD